MIRGYDKNMLGLIFSLDYEIYGNGKGDFNTLMLEPTARLLDLFDTYNAKLTIMAEVAEIMALRKHISFSSVLEKVENQLIEAINRGHDVQLHLHPAWFNARYEGHRWVLDYDEYTLAGLPLDTIDSYIRQGKQYLENLLRKADPDKHYQCIAFRAGNWLMQPSDNIIKALEKNALVYDTSVYKWGCGQVGKYEIDYRTAHSNIFSWVVDPKDINKEKEGRYGLKEIPILTKKVLITSMLTRKRYKLQRQLCRDCKDETGNGRQDLGTGKKAGGLKLVHAKKFDFSRLTFREMKRFISYAERTCNSTATMVPIVAIGHSTEIMDDGMLEKFLSYVSSLGTERIAWTTFSELHANQPQAN
jgi:hypothetical protein